MLKRPKPLNARQGKFAHLVAGGMAATPAYIAAGYKVSDKVAGVNSCRLILENARISALIAKLRAETCDKLDLSRDQLAKHLWAVIMTPISQLTPDSTLIQEYEEITTSIGKDASGEKRIRLRVKSIDKIQAARLLVELLAWKQPERQIHDIGLAAASPDTLKAVAISGSGVAPREGFPAPSESAAEKIRAPFLMLHGAEDTTVRPGQSELLKSILDKNQVTNDRLVFEGQGHPVDQTKREEVFRLVREWFSKHGG